jgi:hypothetical protein
MIMIKNFNPVIIVFFVQSVVVVVGVSPSSAVAAS